MNDITPNGRAGEEILIPVAGGRHRGEGRLIRSVDPADGSTVAEVRSASVEQVDRSVRAGLERVEDPGWRDLLPHQRARYLTRVADLLEERAESIAELQTSDTGKTLGESRALVASAAGTFRYFAAVLETEEGLLTPSRGPYLSMSVTEPIGVVGAITPWNSPIASDAQKVAPALAAGNAVVLKPAEVAPLTALELARAVADAGVPPELLSVVPGSGSVVGDAIVRHPLVGKVALTGGTTTGRRIGAVAAEKVMPVSMELGGKSPTVVFEDADIDQALAGVLYGVFSSSGQSCVAGSRVFVDERIHDTFVERLCAAADRLRIGPGTDPATQIAPMVSLEHRDHVAAMVEAAVAQGARVRAGGTVPAEGPLAGGAYYPPTVLDGVANSARICQEEIFGPVAVVLPFGSEKDLVEQANDSVYGLACGLWTADYRRAWRVARRIRAGTVWVNTYKQLSVSTPFGGTKLSGLGREKGRTGLLAYTRQKSVYLGLDESPLPWAGDAVS